jgi:hypothetical protein
MANLQGIYMLASPENPFTSIANANSSVRFDKTHDDVFFVKTRNSAHRPNPTWLMSAQPSDLPILIAAPAPLVEPVQLKCH